jgi:hypothetical protein
VHAGTTSDLQTLDDVYKYILSNTSTSIRSKYSDFPHTDLEDLSPQSDNYTYKKLPYLKIELTDKKGKKDKSYSNIDAWSPYDSDRNALPRKNNYTFNTNETVLKYDK